MVCFISLVIQHWEGYLEPVPLPRHPHLRAVWVRRGVLLALHVSYHPVFADAPPDQSYTEGYTTNGLLSSRRSHLFEHGHIADSCQHNAHHQGKRPSLSDTPHQTFSLYLGALTTFHRCRLCPSIRGAVFCQNIHISVTPYARRHVGLLV
jgi:hypothetical protein